jgi:hypothetical protein
VHDVISVRPGPLWQNKVGPDQLGKLRSTSWITTPRSLGAWQGALIMLAFGVGTLPNLLAAGWALSRMKRRLAARAVRWAAGAIVAVFAFAAVARPFVPHRWCRPVGLT